MFISSAFAADPTGSFASSPSFLSGIMPLVLIFGVFYFLIIRPNQKKISEHNDMIKSLRRGDKIVTAGGVIGVINKVEDDNILVLEIAPEIKIRVIRETISHVMNKIPVANDNKADNKPAEKSDNKKG